MKIRIELVTAIALSLVLCGTVLAQTNSLQLSLDKISGANLGGQIQGLFQMHVSGPPDIVSVTYELDGKEIGTVTAVPFAFQFHTDSYAPGPHRFSATARTSKDQVLSSNSVSVEIVSLSSGWESVARHYWPLLLVLLIAIGAAVVVPIVTSRSSRRYAPGQAREYGLAGGTVCSRCGRPFGLSLFSPRLIVGRLSRCPYCGKWSLASRASPEALRAAEQSELPAQPMLHQPSTEDVLRQRIEDSRLSR